MHATHQIIKGLGNAHRRIKHSALGQHHYLKEMIKWQAIELVEPAVILQKSLQNYLQYDCKDNFTQKLVNLLISEKSLKTNSDYVLFVIKLLNKFHDGLQTELLEMLGDFFSLYSYYEIYLSETLIQKLTLIDVFIESFKSEVIRAKQELARYAPKSFQKDKEKKIINTCDLLRSYINSSLFEKIPLELKQEIINHILSVLITNQEDEFLRKSAVGVLSKLRKYVDDDKPEIIHKILTLFKRHPNAEHWYLLRKFYHYFSPKDQQDVADVIFQMLPKLENKDHLIVYDFLSLLKRMPKKLQKMLLPSLLNYIDKEIMDKEIQIELLVSNFLNLLLLLRKKVGNGSKVILNSYIKNKITPFNLLWYEPGLLKRVWRKLNEEEKTVLLHEIQSRLAQDSRALIALGDIFSYLPFEIQLLSFNSMEQIDYSKNPVNCLSQIARLKITALVYHHLGDEEKENFLNEIRRLLAFKNSYQKKHVMNIIKCLNVKVSIEIYKNLKEEFSLLLKAPHLENKKPLRISETMRLDLLKKSMTLANNESKQVFVLSQFDMMCNPPRSQLTRRLAAITPFISCLDYFVKVTLLTRLMSLPSKQVAHRQLYSLLYHACEVDVKLNLLQRSIFTEAQTKSQFLSPEIIAHVRKFMF